MKKSRFTDEQIIGFLKQVEAGAAVKEFGRKHGFSDAPFFNWRSRLVDRLLDTAGSDLQIECPSTTTCDFIDHMVSAERLGRLDDGRRRAIVTASPALGVDRLASDRSKDLVEYSANIDGTGLDGHRDTVIRELKTQRRRDSGLRRHQDGHQRDAMARLMKVLEIKGVVPDLVNRGPVEGLCADHPLNRRGRESGYCVAVPILACQNAALKTHKHRDISELVTD
jgi:hypothetical protein